MSSKKSSAEATRERLERIRDKFVSRVGAKKARIIVSTFIGVIALIACLFLGSLFFRIRVIDVSGDVTMFNEGDVIRAAGISEGDLLYLRSSYQIEKKIKKNMPLCKNVDVKKSLSGEISIDISFNEVCFYTRIGNKYYAIDENLRVLDFDESRSKYSSYGAVSVRLPEVREPILGKKLVFDDTVEETDTEGETLYEVQKESFYDFTVEFLTILKSSGYLSGSDAIILDEKFDVELVYADKFLVKFGDSRDLEEKFRLLFEILAEGSINYASRGVIDLSNPAKAFARADESLDFSKYID